MVGEAGITLLDVHADVTDRETAGAVGLPDVLRAPAVPSALTIGIALDALGAALSA